MNFSEMDFSGINLSALSNTMAQSVPDSVRIRQMEEEIENERYEELISRIDSIEDHSKSQAKLAEDEIFFLKQQLELALQRAVDAESGEKKATRISIISIAISFITLLVSIIAVIVSLISGGLI